MSGKTPTASEFQSSLADIFSDSVQRFADRPALDLGGRSWTYRELNQEVCGIDAAIRRAGIDQDYSRVGLIYARSAFSYASIVAIMRCQCVYVPLNPKHPPSHLLKMIEDAGITTLVIDTSENVPEGLLAALRDVPRLTILYNEGMGLSALQQVCAQRGCHSLSAVSQPTSVESCPTQTASEDRPLAYIIYTSGSTGVPKGVAIEHASVCRSIARMHALFGTNEHDRFTQFSPLSFDGSIFDLFLCWISGAACCVPAAEEALVPLSFALSRGITVWGSVPSLANFLLKLRLINGSTLPNIRRSFFFGEALPLELARAWKHAAPASKIFNLYGPTECSICATYFELTANDTFDGAMVPIGVPLPGVRCAVVEDGCPIEKDDVPGELWLSGDQLAVGYWNNPAATGAAFIDAPFDHSGAKWYRTGDLVSDHAGVGLTFRGRVDRQVKLRGFRIELQEIEGLLREEIPSGSVAVVPIRSAGGICEKIVAYCDELPCDEATLKVRCMRRMAPHLVPDRILALGSLPLNANGKVDYPSLAALAAPPPVR